MLQWVARAIAAARGRRGARLRAPRFPGRCVATREEFQALLGSWKSELAARHALEADLASRDESFFVDGHCAVCARATRFWVDRAFGFEVPGARWRAPNWRERLCCEHCQLNNRMRAALHYLFAFGAPHALDPVYVTEQVTPLFRALAARMPRAIGSEYLGDGVGRGATDARGIRNETLTALSFPDACFRYLLTFDVLEHVPDTDAALAECRRVLCPHGTLIFTVPFDFAATTTLRRASLRADGTVEHHVPPEYHGDPLSAAGILSYYTFGWDLLSRLEGHGFARPHAFVYWSRELGYLGGHQVLFTAERR